MPREHDSGYYRHTLAPFSRVNGGAEEFAFVMPTTLPLISFRGAARVAGQFNPFQPNPIISLNPIGAPQGLPFVNNDIYIQESQQQNESGGVDPIGPEQPYE
jgi:hypothetical protein